MQAFFSSTDLQELKDNASIYNFYISLVVNVAEEYVCKIVFPSETTSSYEYVIRDLNGSLKKVTKNYINKEFIEADLEVVMPHKSVPKWVEDRIPEIEAKKKAKLPQVTQTFSNKPYNSFGTYTKQKSIFDDGYYPEYSRYLPATPYLTLDEKFDKFVKSILYLEADATGNISDAIAEINKMSDADWEFYLEALTLNIEIMYDHVYGDAKYPTFDNIFNRFISFLQKQPNTDKMKSLIETLSTEWEVN